jgi:hypothetical protein
MSGIPELISSARENVVLNLNEVNDPQFSALLMKADVSGTEHKVQVVRCAQNDDMF